MPWTPSIYNVRRCLYLNLVKIFLSLSRLKNTHYNNGLDLMNKQECIPVGCVPPAAVAVMGEGAPHPLARSPSNSPLGVGLDQIPLNFPPGCGPELDPPQLPPWVWAWTRSPSTSPLGVGLETPPANHPPGPGNPPPLPMDRILDTRL